MAKFYFALKDGTVDALTGKRDDVGFIVNEPSGHMTADEAIALLEAHTPEYKGRLRAITEEEYARDFVEVCER